MTEQAYHAHGAGLREALELIRRTPTMPFPDPGAHSWRAFAEAVHRAFVRIQQVAEAALREPGADTGTTPPSDVCPECTLGPPNWADRKEGYCAFCNDTGNRPQVKPAERGTTPPEGLEFGLKCAKCGNGPIVEKDIHCEICSPYAPSTIPQACLDAIAKYCNFSTLKEGAAYLRELERAATQRAPVEQGRGATKVIADLRRALEQVRKEAGGKQDYALSNCYNIADTILRRAPWGDVTAPDHAREGATMKCPKCGIDVFAHGETCPVSREGALQAALEALAKVWDEESSMSHDSAPSLCAAQLRRLADGKEN